MKVFIVTLSCFLLCIHAAILREENAASSVLTSGSHGNGDTEAQPGPALDNNT